MKKLYINGMAVMSRKLPISADNSSGIDNAHKSGFYKIQILKDTSRPHCAEYVVTAVHSIPFEVFDGVKTFCAGNWYEYK